MAKPRKPKKAHNPLVDRWLYLIMINLGIIAAMVLVLHFGHGIITFSNGGTRRVLTDEGIEGVKFIGACLLLIVNGIAAFTWPSNKK